MPGEVCAKCVSQDSVNQAESKTIDLYIGVFFDGTNNNKFQVMLGKMFRREEIFKKAQERVSVSKTDDKELLDIVNGKDTERLLSKGKDYWLREGKGIFTSSEIDFLFFGYEKEPNSKENEENDYLFIEKNAGNALDSNHNLVNTQKPNDGTLNTLQEFTKSPLTQNAEDDKYNSIKSGIGQDVTYTNVAIMESLYIVEEKGNEVHMSFYVEGSGADMQFNASTKRFYKLTIGFAGLGLGTGPTGAAAKVRKAANFVNRIVDKYNQKKVAIHFDIVGFSRGATCSRMFSYLINPSKNNSKESYKGVATILQEKDDLKLLTGSTNEFLPIGQIIDSKEIRNLCLFDTVSSIGIKRNGFISNTLKNSIVSSLDEMLVPIKLDKGVGGSISQFIKDNVGGLLSVENILSIAVGYLIPTTKVISKLRKECIRLGRGYLYAIKKGSHSCSKSFIPADDNTEFIPVKSKRPYHDQNVKDYGLWATSLAKNVVHICAMDEVRENFALVDISNSIGDNGTEIFIPGCHTDIGGGAAIEKEAEAIINKGRYLPRYYIHSSKELHDENVLEITEDNLIRLGWADKKYKEKTWWTARRENNNDEETNQVGGKESKNVILYRHITPGYSNVPLKLMMDLLCSKPFKTIPYAYRIPEDLENYYSSLKEIIDNNQKKRIFCYPADQTQYQNLRANWIHFSTNQRWYDKDTILTTDIQLVNSPSFVKIGNNEVVSRTIYRGDLLHDEKLSYICQYQDDGVKVEKINYKVSDGLKEKKRVIHKNQQAILENKKALIQENINKIDRQLYELNLTSNDEPIKHYRLGQLSLSQEKLKKILRLEQERKQLEDELFNIKATLAEQWAKSEEANRLLDTSKIMTASNEHSSVLFEPTDSDKEFLKGIKL